MSPLRTCVKKQRQLKKEQAEHEIEKEIEVIMERGRREDKLKRDTQKRAKGQRKQRSSTMDANQFLDVFVEHFQGTQPTRKGHGAGKPFKAEIEQLRRAIELLAPTHAEENSPISKKTKPAK